jgi:uncharacterized protein (DUF58 family)
MRRPRVKLKTEGVEERVGETVDRRWYYLSVGLALVSIPFHLPLLLVIGLLLLLILSIIDIWVKYCLYDLSYQRQFSEKRVLFGEEITLSLLIENAKLLPLPWLETEDSMPSALVIKEQQLHSALTSKSGTLQCLFSPGWYERVTRPYTIRCIMRGVHTFGPTTLRSGDVFGFISREKKLANYQYVLVYPLVVPLTRFGLPARHPFGDLRTPRRLLEDPARVIGVRDYAYGDSLRRVNWKATARTQQLQSKVYEETATHTLILFLNTTTRMDMHYGVHPELQELAICVAASVASWGLDQGYAVGLHANSILFIPDESPSLFQHDETVEERARIEEQISEQMRRRRIHVPAASNVEQRSRIMEALARSQNFFGGNIEEIIQRERTHLPTGSTVVVITGSINDMLIDMMTRIRYSGHAVSLLFVGDTPPPMKLAGLNIYHVGGEEQWQTLVAANNTLQDGATSSIDKLGFQL